MALKRLCKAPGCNGLAEFPERYCSKHMYLKRRDEERREAFLSGKDYTPQYVELYNDPKWRQMKKKHLQEEPYCRYCGAKATEVDHIVAHRGDVNLFFDEDNLQSLCSECHSKKTMNEIAERNKERHDRYNRIKRNNLITDNYTSQW